MKKEIKLVLQGFIIGLGKIIPGVSGSMIAVSMGLYETCIKSISNLFSDFKKNIIFLGTIGIGIILSVIFGSKIIVWLLKFYYIPTMILFVGFIAGGIPSLSKHKRINNIWDIFLIVLGFLIIFLIDMFSPSQTFNPTICLKDFLFISILGFIDALTMIVPGISGTAVFVLLGCYDFILKLLGNIFNINYFYYFIFFCIGLIIGVLLISRIINYCFKNFKNKTYMIILGLSLSSIYVMFKTVVVKISGCSEIVFGLFLLIIGYKISKNKLS